MTAQTMLRREAVKKATEREIWLGLVEFVNSNYQNCRVARGVKPRQVKDSLAGQLNHLIECDCMAEKNQSECLSCETQQTS